MSDTIDAIRIRSAAWAAQTRGGAEGRRYRITELEPCNASRASYDRWLLLAEIDRLKHDLRAMTTASGMACQEPADDCWCPGCKYADEVHGKKT